MREGDVFCGILPDSGEALAIVVREIEKNGDSVTVYGVQPTLEDLFESIEIEATYGADALIVDELAEGVTMEETPADPSLSAEIPRATNLAAHPAPGLTAQNLASQTVEINRTFTQALRVENDYTFVEGSVSETIESVTVSLDYTRGKDKVVASVVTRTTDSLRADLGIQAGWEDDFEIGEFHVKTSIPFVTVPLELSVHVSFSGSVGGTFEYEQTRLSGSEVTATTMGVTHRDIDEVVSKDVKADFVNFQAEVKVGPQISIGVAVFKDLLRVDLALGMGVKIEAEYAPFEPWDEFADSCHDCGVCFDGEISLFVELVGSAKASFPGLEPVTASITMAEVTKKLNDFYVSLGPDGRADPRFGWGECPYRRYRTEVKVSNKFGEIYGAEVHASYPDGRVETQWSNEYGMAVFWLPEGRNWLAAEYGGRINGDHYEIAAKPGKAEVKLDFDQRVIVVCDMFMPEEDPALIASVRARYPDAEFYTNANLDFYEWYIDDPWRVERFVNHFVEDVDVGDIIICLDPYGAGLNNHIESMLLLVIQEHGELDFLTVYGNSVGADYEYEVEATPNPDRPGWDAYVDFYVSEVYFDVAEKIRTDAEIDEQFNLINKGYMDEGFVTGLWSTRKHIYKTEYTWYHRDYGFMYAEDHGLDHNTESNGYIESQADSWGQAAIDYGMQCLFQQVDALLVD